MATVGGWRTPSTPGRALSRRGPSGCGGGNRVAL